MIEEAVSVLIRHPLIGRPVEYGLRELVISRGRSGYMALYSLEEAHDAVLILAIRHQREAGYLGQARTAFEAYPMPHTQHALGQQLLILGRKISERTAAMAYAEEARSLLEPLDEIMESDDTYPIVTLPATVLQ